MRWYLRYGLPYRDVAEWRIVSHQVEVMQSSPAVVVGLPNLSATAFPCMRRTTVRRVVAHEMSIRYGAGC